MATPVVAQSQQLETQNLVHEKSGTMAVCNTTVAAAVVSQGHRQGRACSIAYQLSSGPRVKSMVLIHPIQYTESSGDSDPSRHPRSPPGSLCAQITTRARATKQNQVFCKGSQTTKNKGNCFTKDWVFCKGSDTDTEISTLSFKGIIYLCREFVVMAMVN